MTEKIMNIVVKAYIKVMGLEKWNSLTDEEKHNVVMILVRDLNNRI